MKTDKVFNFLSYFDIDGSFVVVEPRGLTVMSSIENAVAYYPTEGMDLGPFDNLRISVASFKQALNTFHTKGFEFVLGMEDTIDKITFRHYKDSQEVATTYIKNYQYDSSKLELKVLDRAVTIPTALLQSVAKTGTAFKTSDKAKAHFLGNSAWIFPGNSLFCWECSNVFVSDVVHLDAVQLKLITKTSKDKEGKWSLQTHPLGKNVLSFVGGGYEIQIDQHIKNYRIDNPAPNWDRFYPAGELTQENISTAMKAFSKHSPNLVLGANKLIGPNDSEILVNHLEFKEFPVSFEFLSQAIKAFPPKTSWQVKRNVKRMVLETKIGDNIIYRAIS